MTDSIPELPTDRHFLDFSEMCLYMVHFGLESTIKVDQNQPYG